MKQRFNYYKKPDKKIALLIMRTSRYKINWINYCGKNFRVWEKTDYIRIGSVTESQEK